MGALAVGEVVLVPFPFSDLSQTKIRPAVCLLDAGRGDWVMCQITSNPYGDMTAVQLDDTDFLSGGLLTTSYARPNKLFTAHHGIVIRSVGTLNDAAIAKLYSVIALLFNLPSPS